MRISVIWIFLLIFPIGTVFAQSDAYVQRRALQKFTEVYGGGRDAEALTSVSIEGMQEQGGVVYDFLLRKKRPELFRYKLSKNGHSVVTGYDGTVGWMQTEEEGKSKTRQLSDAEVQQLKREMVFEGPLFKHMERNSHEIEMTGRERVEGKDVIVLVVRDSDGRRVRYYLDTRESYILKMERLADDGTVTLTTFYRDYRKVGGYPFAHRVETLVGGNLVSKVTVNSVSVNSGLLDFYFRMPN